MKCSITRFARRNSVTSSVSQKPVSLSLSLHLVPLCSFLSVWLPCFKPSWQCALLLFLFLVAQRFFFSLYKEMWSLIQPCLELTEDQKFCSPSSSFAPFLSLSYFCYVERDFLNKCPKLKQFPFLFSLFSFLLSVFLFSFLFSSPYSLLFFPVFFSFLFFFFFFSETVRSSTFFSLYAGKRRD